MINIYQINIYLPSIYGDAEVIEIHQNPKVNPVNPRSDGHFFRPGKNVGFWMLVVTMVNNG